MKKISAIDLFCGAGGTSTGLLQACEANGLGLDLTAVNHWPVAISTHSANHEYAEHLCESLEFVDPKKLVPSGVLDLLVASPECTHHSNARGGRPMSDQSRSTAWRILEWCSEIYIKAILIENVPEFKTWGPLGKNGRPLKAKKGALFHQFVSSLRALGYRVEHRILNCADYGDPTTRRRFFLIARRDSKPIVWPEPTHCDPKKLKDSLFNDRLPWVAAREIIDWSLPGESIFTRKKPLAKKTLERIYAGLEKFGGPNADPFLVVLRRHMDGQSVEGPLPAILAGGQHIGIVEPVLVQYNGTADSRSIDDPMGTQTTKDRYAVAEPFILPHRQFDKMDVDPIDNPVRTITATNGRRNEVCMPVMVPFILPHQQFEEGAPDDIERPLRTVTAHNGDEFKVVDPVIIRYQKGEPRGVDDPIPTQTANGCFAVVEPFIFEVAHYTEGEGHDRRLKALNQPLGAITCKGSKALATPLCLVTKEGIFGLDIRMRMLKPHELSAAMGFPKDYEFKGTKTDQVRQIGNAVPVKTARALCSAILGIPNTQTIQEKAS